MPGYVGSDGRFAIFDTPESGFNAMGNLLQSYGNRGFNTVSSILNRYSPQSDPTNKPGSTKNYVNVVAKEVGVDPAEPLDLSDPNILNRLVRSMTKVEAGGDYFSTNKMSNTAPAATAAPAQAPTGFGGQVANFLFGPPQPRSPDAFASDASPGLIAQATGGLIGGGRAEPFSVGFDTPRPYQPEFVKPEKQYGAAFAGSAPDMSGGSATLTSFPPTISAAPAAGAAGIGSALASLGGALAKAGAAKEDMSWVQRPAETHRGKWDDEIFKRSIFGIRGLLG